MESIGKLRKVAARKSTAIEERQARAPRKNSPEESTGWRRTPGDQSMIQELGLRIRAVREERRLSLAQLSEKTGIPGATLSRIENSKMSPTFGVLARVMMGLDVDWGDLVGPKRLQPGERLASFADPGGGKATAVRESRAIVLHSHAEAHSLPLLVEVHARDLAAVGGLIGHRGEEFCYVLSGTLVMHMEGKPPRIMKAGASALFDSATPHAYLSGGSAGAKILIVVNRAYGSHVEAMANQPRT